MQRYSLPPNARSAQASSAGTRNNSPENSSCPPLVPSGGGASPADNPVAGHPCPRNPPPGREAAFVREIGAGAEPDAFAPGSVPPEGGGRQGGTRCASAPARMPPYRAPGPGSSACKAPVDIPGAEGAAERRREIGWSGVQYAALRDGPGAGLMRTHPPDDGFGFHASRIHPCRFSTAGVNPVFRSIFRISPSIFRVTVPSRSVRHRPRWHKSAIADRS